MAKNLSLAELTALYSNKGKNPEALFEVNSKTSLNTALPGSSTAEKLSKLFFTRQNGLLPVRPRSWKPDNEHNTIAICMVIVDVLFHEEIWRHWVEQGDLAGSRYKAQLFIHAKYPERVTSSWVKEHLVDVTFRPDWNSIEVVQSLLSLLDTALQYSPQSSSHKTDIATAVDANTASTHMGACGRFVLATESCLPLYDLQTTGEMLFKEDCSWLKAYNTPQGSWEAGTCFRAVDPDIVPPKSVWKSLPGWIMLNRLHAMEIITLTKMLGGWGQPSTELVSVFVSEIGRSDGNVVIRPEYNILSDLSYRNSHKGTVGMRWVETVRMVQKSNTIAAPSGIDAVVDINALLPADPATANGKAASIIADTGCPVESDGSVTADSETTQNPVAVATAASNTAAITSTTSTTQSTTAVAATTQPSLLSAWGAGGTWHEHNGSVFAPEEVFFPTVLSLLGYLRDSTTTTNGNNSSDNADTGVKIASVTFAEWAKKGDANPIAYDYFDAHLVQRMRATGAVFGRKFSANSVTIAEWRRVAESSITVGSPPTSHAARRSDSRERSTHDRYRSDSQRDDYRYSNNSNQNRDNHRYNSNFHDSRYKHDTDRYSGTNYMHDRKYENQGYSRDYPDSKRRKY